MLMFSGGHAGQLSLTITLNFSFLYSSLIQEGPVKFALVKLLSLFQTHIILIFRIFIKFLFLLPIFGSCLIHLFNLAYFSKGEQHC